MRSFDHAVKYLLQHEPAGFLSFAFADRSVRVVEAVPSVLPARGRDIDGAYVIASGDLLDDAQYLAHVELYRRHQSVKELGTDVAEAQVRLFRREGKLVVTHLWDLYGDAAAPVREEHRLAYGADGSTCVYQRINLRGMGWEQLVAEGPPALWPLVALTRDGARASVVEKVADAIRAHPTWSEEQRTGHLSVLWFVSQAEGVPELMLRAVLVKEQLMESELYLEIFGDGEKAGKAQGKAEGVLVVLAARGIPVSEAIRARILGCADVATLDGWLRRAVVATTAAAVVRAKSPARRPAVSSRHA
jgi:hypothetical protein